MKPEAYQKRYEAYVSLIEPALTKALEGRLAPLQQSMAYSLLAGGKRLRPMLMQETYRMFGGTDRVIEPFMAAIEMIHTSSLVHDDLPCMDDDMIRRGKASTWAEYGEDIGVLAGDALMMYAFETEDDPCGIWGRYGNPDRGCASQLCI